ncbi:putative secreted protein [Wickerhamomyces ciferrii]|uniref:Secreted protein n=1 Tax=Wickerhamomyces ciferrii (strain ATCC 14091 / BCRC 22168 / CBS 111 / JCM 3599 / NBRC 0793 / NRRL Y-1031 F-60-10) TaxID=1206466 RepID=K0KU82_WICCF|nr:uncharacterized protein BN7_4562 [Wickerhamomyces ciferrii]CCH44984.1 putative secreted protein [Wickerhamomyces ciferrii]
MKLISVFVRTIILFICFNCVESTWYFSEHRICDATGDSWLPFSGFRIHRKFMVKNLKPPMLHFVSLSHCNQGELNYERLIRTGRETDIEWDKPICFFREGNGNDDLNHDDGINLKESKSNNDQKKKGDKKKSSLEDTLTKGKHLKSVNPSHSNIAKQKDKIGLLKSKQVITIDEVSKKPHSISKSNLFNHTAATTSSSDLNKRDKDPHLHKQTFNALVRKISSKARFIEYKQDSLVTDLEDLEPISYQELSNKDLNNLKCFKLARRKKYAERQMMVYAPYTWVGGLFECNVNNDIKRQYIQSLKDSRDFIQPFDFKCDSKESTPLFPLIADDVTSQWIDKEKGASVSQRIPYLYTPGVLDVRYGKSAKSLGVKHGDNLFEGHDIIKKNHDSVSMDHWFKEVEINENYNYTKQDLQTLDSTTNSSSNLFDKFLQSDKKFLQPWEWDSKELLGNDNEGIGYLEHKFLSVMGRIKDKLIVDDFLNNVQEHWDNVTLSAEKLIYKLH